MRGFEVKAAETGSCIENDVIISTPLDLIKNNILYSHDQTHGLLPLFQGNLIYRKHCPVKSSTLIPRFLKLDYLFAQEICHRSAI